jgi:cold shock CspA family protein
LTTRRDSSGRRRKLRLCDDGRQSRRRRGTVRTFDERLGRGEIEADDGATFGFHSTAIADGTRRIAPGTAVEFDVVARLPGRWEAAKIEARSA